MGRLRRRLARLLVGPFVNIPERDGVWVVTRMTEGRALVIYEADKFRLKTGVKFPHADDRVYGDLGSLSRYGFASRYGRFVGTVKYR